MQDENEQESEIERLRRRVGELEQVVEERDRLARELRGRGSPSST